MGDTEQNRLLRLKQVRQQSKNIAHNIREKVTSEKQKQEQRIKAQRTKEMGEWKRRQLQQKSKQFAGSLSLIGEAHAAAEKEMLLPAVPNKFRSRSSSGRRKEPEVPKKSINRAIQTSPKEEIELVKSSSDSDSSTLVDDLQTISSSDISDDISLEISKLMKTKSTQDPLKRKQSDEVINLPSSFTKSYFSGISNLIKNKCGPRDLAEDIFTTNPSTNSHLHLSRSPPSRDLCQSLQEETVKKVPEKAPGRIEKKKITKSPGPVNRKVHYYHHGNRFHKHYIPSQGIVSKAGPSRNQQNAIQKAREVVHQEKCLAKMREVENRERRRLENIRSTQALEKERLRRNYEDLLSKVDELLDQEDSERRDAIEGEITSKADEDFVARSADSSEALEMKKTSKKIAQKTDNDIDIDLNLKDILGKILQKLDENKVQIIEGIMSRKDKENDEVKEDKFAKIVEKQRDIGVQSEIVDKEASDSVGDEIEIQTLGQSEKVQVVSTVKDPEESNSKKKPQIQIVINVKDTPNVGNLSRIPEEITDLNTERKKKRSVFHKDLSDALGKKYPKTPEKQGKILIDTISSINSESSGSTVYRSPPEAILNDFALFAKGPGEKKVKPSGSKVTTERSDDKKSQLMRKYITRLLKMPRTEVDQLSVSSGTQVPTPNCSVVNVPANIEPEIVENIPQRAEPKSSKGRKKMAAKASSRDLSRAEKGRDFGSSLRNKTKEEQQKATEPISVNVQDPEDLREKYAEYAEIYTRKIQKLSKMINDVRSEKNRLLAATPIMSSGSDNGNTSTKYKDFPNMAAPGESGTDMSSVSELKSTSLTKDEGPSGNIDNTNLTTCKTIGMSKDSGISISRPVTSTELRDSPEIRWMPSKKPEKGKGQQELEASSRKISSTAARPGNALSSSHELSTIAELDTSRLQTSGVSNQSKIEEAFKDLKDAIERISNEIEYKKFPSFDEYVHRLAENLQEQSTGADADIFEQDRKFLEYLKDLSREMIMNRFPTYQEFLEKEGVPAKEESEDAVSENGVSDFTLPDVVAELIQRNIMDHSFRNSPENSQDEIQEGIEPPKENCKPTSVAQSSSGSSINLEADFRKVGLRWAASMLERTHEHQQLSSSDSSTQLNAINPKLRTSALNLPADENSFVDRNIARSPRKKSHNATEVTEESQIGKPLNLLEFLNRELDRNSQKQSSYSAEDSTLTNTLLKSLLGSEISAKENPIHRTSTPITGSKMIKSTDRNFRNSSSVTISSEGKLSSIESLKE
ncbi:uncharacterized protein LOC129799609 [Phlebotomus papatasi]|uniref:uncharacterized protein LOC129799609 n=1 Tax=Phlebotomus papatasi TaxID=29031 RepID=UPI0024842105|nr:uncharacterized protein LOC129799609 [Phlebotomus papatasi]